MHFSGDDNLWLSYEDEKSMNDKTQFAMMRKYAGIMVDNMGKFTFDLFSKYAKCSFR